MDLDRREFLGRLAVAAGGALSSSCVSAILERDASLPARAESPVFTPEQRELVAAAAEAIIPTTDTPGARAAGVPDFVEMMVADWYREVEREAFLAGLSRLDASSREKAGVDFAAATPEVQEGILHEFERQGLAELQASGAHPLAALASGDPPKPIFHALKELVVVGYYTSTVGATKELVFNPIPGSFIGCLPVPPHGRAWAE